MDTVNFVDKFSMFSDQWSPKVIAELNDYQFKLAKIEGEFVWHDHKDTDEAFIVFEGSMVKELRDRKVELNTGEMYVIPKGIEHKPYAEDECKIMLIEPKGITNTGSTKSELTAEQDQWI